MGGPFYDFGGPIYDPGRYYFDIKLVANLVTRMLSLLTVHPTT